MKNNTHLSFTESVMRLSVIRTDQIFGCPFQPEDEFEPDYHIHGLVLKRERERGKKKKKPIICLFVQRPFLYCRSPKSQERSQLFTSIKVSPETVEFDLYHLPSGYSREKAILHWVAGHHPENNVSGASKAWGTWSSLSNDCRQGLLSSSAVYIYIYPSKIDHKGYCQLVKARILPS